MYNVLEVCRHIINYCNKNSYIISNLKLQKLLYFVQAYFLSHTPSGEPCFVENIEAWDFGPVVPDAYYEFKEYGSSSIPRINKYYALCDDGDGWSLCTFHFNDDVIKPEHKQIIDEIVSSFSKYSATDLVTITHNQKPWMEAYSLGKNTIITHESIRRYFNG